MIKQISTQRKTGLKEENPSLLEETECGARLDIHDWVACSSNPGVGGIFFLSRLWPFSVSPYC